MAFEKHRNILDYTLQTLLRRKFKNAGIILVFTFVIFIVGSIVFLSYSLKREARLLFKNSPDIIVQKMRAGRHELIPVTLGNDIMGIAGVSNAGPRYWGYYYDSGAKANYTILGISTFGLENNRMLTGRLPSAHERGVAAIGRGIADVRIIKKDIGSTLYLQDADGKWMDFNIVGIFESDSEILTDDLIVMSEDDFKYLVKMPSGTATDLAVNVYNETEIPTIAGKIKERFPDSRPILRDEIIRTYDAVFSWRSGLIVTLFIGALTAFIILAWDKATGLSAEEKQEIGILKAVGWETSDILEMKFWEGVVVSLTSFLCGIIIAYVHIFFMGAFLFAPALKGWSVIYPDFRLTPFIDFYQIAILLSVTVIPYIASTIIPSWKAAITDPDIVMRG
ncbi:MAG: ABC transporter permease [Nitrospirae bacterium]|nr:ABC transporter permease [Nitrospirota bacterium]